MNDDLHIELSWARAVPMLLEVYAHAETPAARAEAREELMRLGQIGDEHGVLVAKLKEPTQDMIDAADELIPIARGTESYRSFPLPEDIFTAMVAPLLTSPEPTES